MLRWWGTQYIPFNIYKSVRNVVRLRIQLITSLNATGLPKYITRHIQHRHMVWNMSVWNVKSLILLLINLCVSIADKYINAFGIHRATTRFSEGCDFVDLLFHLFNQPTTINVLM